MTFACLWIPAAPTGAAEAPARSAELAAALLGITPRVRVQGPLLWADGRGLAARPFAGALLEALDAEGVRGQRVGIAAVPVAAEVAARHGGAPLVAVPAGGERAWLAPFPLAVLAPAPELTPLFAGTGIESCADLARLSQESVEVRFGPAGVALWRLARADDRRLLFDPVPRPLPHASLAWTDYALDDPERLLFVVNRLAGSVCAALHERGQGARTFTLAFSLERGGVVEQPFHPSRASADQRAWIRLIRDTLERIRLPAGVAGIALRVDAAGTSESVQGDLLDRGFASAGAAAAAIAKIIERDATVVTPHNSRHPLLRRRTTWIPEQPSFIWARPQLGPGDAEPALMLHLLPEPEPVEMETTPREGFTAPVRYRGRDGWHALVSAAGPDCLSGGRWDTAYACEAWCCLRADGELVQLCRDARSGRWEVHGLWR